MKLSSHALSLSILLFAIFGCSSKPAQRPPMSVIPPQARASSAEARLDANNDNKVDLEEFMLHVGRIYGTHQNQKKKSIFPKDCLRKELCQSMDVNKSGDIDMDEYFRGHLEAFKKLDRNGDGALSQDELKEVLK